MPLNPNNVSPKLEPLLSVAEKWGIGDDFDREAAIARASRQELEELVHSIDDVNDEDLYGWLSGPESFNPNPSNEYLAFSCLTMAIDSAKLKLKKLP